MSSPCNTKVLYDTEFSADVAASKSSYLFNKEMISYRCGRHWHIATKDKNQRGYNLCGKCGYIKGGSWDTHLLSKKHNRKETP